MRSVLLSRRWILATAAAVVVAGTCVGLGMWQLDRLEQRRAFNGAVRAGIEQPPAPAGEVLGGEDPSYRRVVAEGTFDVNHEVLWYGRSLDGSPGHHVLTPLRPAGGGPAILVDRGWVPFELDRPPISEAAPPTGTVRVEGVLFPSQDGDGPADAQAAGLYRRADLDEIAAALPYALADQYLLLRGQAPTQPSELPLRAGLPELTEGPHLSYAVQWFTFATIALIVYLVLLRRDLADGGV